MKLFKVRFQGVVTFESVNTEELKKHAQSGLITEGYEICQVGSDHWIPASKVKGLFSNAPATAPSEGIAISDDHLTDAIGRTGQMAKDVSEALFNTKTLPSRLTDLMDTNEAILYASRPSTIVLILRLLVVSVWAVLVFAAIIGGFMNGAGTTEILILALGFFGALIAISYVRVYLKWKNTYYVITPKRSFMMVGILAVKVKIINNKNIQMISINTGLFDRWLGLNTIEFKTAARGGGINSIMGLFGGASSGDITFKSVNADKVVPHYSK
jgi:membrane protein YdbS with pleckstrin-like domain